MNKAVELRTMQESTEDAAIDRALTDIYSTAKEGNTLAIHNPPDTLEPTPVRMMNARYERSAD
jgi:hypothetical protein